MKRLYYQYFSLAKFFQYEFLRELYRDGCGVINFYCSAHFFCLATHKKRIVFIDNVKSSAEETERKSFFFFFSILKKLRVRKHYIFHKFTINTEKYNDGFTVSLKSIRFILTERLSLLKNSNRKTEPMFNKYFQDRRIRRYLITAGLVRIIC